jgi:uncharacterized membrane protein YqgA involved in biofilm formation
MEITGFISIGILIVFQIATFAFCFGKLNGKVDSIDKRLNDLSHRFDKIEERVHQLEVKK